MKRLLSYIDAQSLSFIITTLSVLAVLYFLTPRKQKFDFCLMLLPIWLTLSLCKNMPIMPFFKLALPIPLAGIIFSAIRDPSPRRKLPVITLTFHLLALLSFCFVIRLDDQYLALVYRFLWLLMGICAHVTIKKIGTIKDLYRVITALGKGVSISVFIMATTFINGAYGFRLSFLDGRLYPWGTHPNSIGFLYFLAVGFTGILHETAQTKAQKTFYLTACVMATCMALLTCSRSVIFPLVIMVCILLRRTLRRPGVLIIAALLTMIALHFILAHIDTLNWSRLNTLHSRRSVIFLEYWEVFKSRPLLGVFTSYGETYHLSQHASARPHNGFIYQFYLFGITLGAPFTLLFLFGQWSALFVWVKLRSQAVIMADTLFAMTTIMLFHGMVAPAIYEPTNHYAFLNIFLTMLFITLNTSKNKLLPTTEHPTPTP